jgi:hypothetical protein
MKSMFNVKHRGSFLNTDCFFHRTLKREYIPILEQYGRLGVDLLKEATPSLTGETAGAWDYHIEEGDGKVRIVWTNSNNNDGVNVALLIIYGHGLQNGSYVQGNDFVTPVMRPMFTELADKAWREVTK